MMNVNVGNWRSVVTIVSDAVYSVVRYPKSVFGSVFVVSVNVCRMQATEVKDVKQKF